MSAVIVGKKGQIVIPAEIRAELGIKAGSPIGILKTREGWLIKHTPVPVSALKDSLEKPCSPVSIEAMNLAIRRRFQKLSALDNSLLVRWSGFRSARDSADTTVGKETNNSAMKLLELEFAMTECGLQ